jgi:hypothetical protein
MPDDIEANPLDEPNNFERGDRALRAIVAYNNNLPLNIENEAMLIEVGDATVVTQGSPIAYLIADLCHVMRRHDLQIDEILTGAIEHFGSDVIEQAWLHDDNWDNELQTDANTERARQVMATAGVPSQYHDGALRKSGLL